MKFDVPYVFVVIALLSGTSLALPVQRRALPTIKILASSVKPRPANPNEPDEHVCDDNQVTAIKAGMVEAKALADAAVSALRVAGVENSEAVKTWLGSSTPNPLSAQVTKRFSNPSAAFAQSVTLVADTVAGNDLFFLCPTTCVAGSNAFTLNTIPAGPAGSQINAISFCSPFFDATTSFAQDKKNYDDTPVNSRRDKTKGKFPPPKAKGSILLHEAQHSLPVLQSTDENDNLRDFIATPTAINNRIIAGNTGDFTQNAENWALLAFLAAVDRPRFTPGNCNARRATNGTSGGVCQLPGQNPSSISTSLAGNATTTKSTSGSLSSSAGTANRTATITSGTASLSSGVRSTQISSSSSGIHNTTTKSVASSVTTKAVSSSLSSTRSSTSSVSTVKATTSSTKTSAIVTSATVKTSAIKTSSSAARTVVSTPRPVTKPKPKGKGV